jgi:hypothetical protein
MSFLCDTNVLAELARPRPNRAVLAWAHRQARLTISVVTLEEVWYGLAWRPNPRLVAWFESFFDTHCDILPIDARVARIAGALRGRMQSQGRPRTQADMLIAATAKQGELTVVTRNTADFSGCGVRVLNPWSE